MSNEDMTLEELQDAVTGTLVEDCDEDVWQKLDGGTWHILDSAGISAPVGHSSRFLHDPENGCGPVKHIGVTSRIPRNPNELKVTMPEAPRLPEPVMLPGAIKLPGNLVLPPQSPKTEPVALEVASRGLTFGGTSPKYLYELVKEGQYFVQPDTNFETFTEGLRYGCNEHLDMYFHTAMDSGQLDVVDLLKWVEIHEAEYHDEKEDCNGNG